jgi:Tol biopolymer transport system component/tRNA A-37 threonylcarbamoyl transferase component Bud32
MSLAPDTLVTALADRYRIERELGAGGMATVYLAHDLRHDRRVALKVLRPELAAVIGAERFLHEIKTTANLQHSHILPLFDSGQVDGTVFYVMPFVAGESLRDRLDREKQLPIAEAVRIGMEVASALDYAHRQGIIHRDIKPENILLHDGSALVADFGIALAAASTGGARMTETGMSLGTPHYMSPEQAMGERDITARSDVYALGCVLYEMLLGEPPFSGPTAQAIVAKVMTEKPAPMIPRRDTIPEAVEAAVLTALAKLPADRFATASEFADALAGRGAATAARLATRPAPAELGRWRRTALLLGGIAAIATIAAVAGWLRPRPREPVAHYELRVPGLRRGALRYLGGTFALSQDGARVAYVAADGTGRTQLMVRERDKSTARPVAGTTDADGVFFSPDGKSVAYYARGSLYRVAIDGGAPVKLSDSATFTTAAGYWDADGTIYYVGAGDYALKRIRDNGERAPGIAPPPTFAASFPFPLPGGRWLLATTCTNNCARMTLNAVDLRTGTWKELVENTARGWYLPTGHLMFIRPDGNVFGVRFDPDKAELLGAPTPLLTGVNVDNGIYPQLEVAQSGTIAYVGTIAQRDFAVVRVDRAGHAKPVDPSWRAQFNSLALSPDGARLAVSIATEGRTDLWVKQLEQGPLTRLTFDGTLNYRGAWQPDGRSLSFTSDRSGGSYLYRIRADGSGTPTRLLPSDTTQVDEAEWSRDGNWLVLRAGVSDNNRKLYARRTSGDTALVELVAGPSDAYTPSLSPDGRWLAYVSAESGQEEVYVRPFPNAADARWQVSVDGGTAPAWAHSGRELYYIGRDQKMTAAELAPGSGFRVSTHRELFALGRLVNSPYHRSYDVTPDDRGFIMFEEGELTTTAGEAYLRVILNWFDEVKAAMGRQ